MIRTAVGKSISPSVQHTEFSLREDVTPDSDVKRNRGCIGSGKNVVALKLSWLRFLSAFVDSSFLENDAAKKRKLSGTEIHSAPDSFEIIEKKHRRLSLASESTADAEESQRTERQGQCTRFGDYSAVYAETQRGSRAGKIREVRARNI